MCRVACAVALTIAASALLTGCGGGSVTAPVSYQQRDAVTTRVEERLASLSGADRAADLAVIAAYMRSQPEFEDADVAEEYGCAWGRFVDGPILVVRNDPPPTGEGESLARSRECTSTLREGQPVGKARVLQCLSGYAEAAPWIRDWLSSAGYATGVELESPTVERLRTVSGEDGVFYISSHGGGGVVDKGQGPRFCLMTATPVTGENEKRYAEELRDHSLMILSCDISPTERGRRYGITAKFVADNMRFGDNSLVYMDACFSNDREFREACFAANASLYAGWTGPVLDWVAARAALFMFDRMLGANAITQAAEVPPQRPFDYVRTYADLAGRGWHRNPSEGMFGASGPVPGGRDIIVNPKVPTLVFTAGTSGDCGMLAPSIEFLKVDELPADARPGFSHLHVYGQFGADPGEGAGSVTINTSGLSILSWTPCEIVCEIPSSGADFAGRVQVRCRGHMSNVVPLTAWWTRVHYVLSYQDGLCSDEFTLLIHMRFDVHGYRREPADEGWRYPLAQFDKYDTGVSIAQDSRGTWEATGDWSETWPVLIDPPQYATRYHSYSGSGDVAFAEHSSEGNYCSGTAQLRFDTGAQASGVIIEPPSTLYIHLTLSAGATGKTETVSLSTGPGSTTSPSPLSAPSNAVMDLVIDDAYRIEPGRALAAPSLGESAGVLEWLQSEPSHAPDAATARGD